MKHLQSLTVLITQPTAVHLLMLVGIVIVGFGALLYLCTLHPTVLISAGIGLEIFSNNWSNFFVKVPLSRGLLLLGLIVLIVRGPAAISRRRIVFRPIHFLLFALIGYVIVNALWAGTLFHSYGYWAITDRLGVIPMLLFVLAPVLFGTEKQRNVLLITSVVTGFYLGFIGCAEGLKLKFLVFPTYISDPNLGITQSRARGPFLASDAMGISLFFCAALACVALTKWKNPWARLACFATVGMSAIGIVFTETRSVWIGAAVGLAMVMLLDTRLRRWFPLVAAGGAAGIFAMLVVLPGFRKSAGARYSMNSSVWDRYNTNKAAYRAWLHHPFFGIGWQTFETKGDAYLREAGSYPLTGSGLEVHNVFLSHLAELGALGAVLWTWALLSAVGAACFRSVRPEMRAWRLALMAMFACFVVVANLGPLSYALPNLMIWLVAGVVAVDRNSAPRDEESVRLLDSPEMRELAAEIDGVPMNGKSAKRPSRQAAAAAQDER